MGWGGVGHVNVRVNLLRFLMLRWWWGGVGWGMLTFVWTCWGSWCYSDDGVWWGGVGHVNVLVKLLRFLMLRWWWGGVGWGMLTFVWTCWGSWCYADDGVGWDGTRNLLSSLSFESTQPCPGLFFLHASPFHVTWPLFSAYFFIQDLDPLFLSLYLAFQQVHLLPLSGKLLPQPPSWPVRAR